MYIRMSRTMSKLRLWSNHTFLSETRNLRNATTMLLSARRAKRTQTAAVHLQRRCTRIETQCPAETRQHHPAVGCTCSSSTESSTNSQNHAAAGHFTCRVPTGSVRCKCTTSLQVYHRHSHARARVRGAACASTWCWKSGKPRRSAGGTNVLSVFCATFSQSVPERSLRTVSTFWYSISPCLCRTML